ncbi:hypothetical protein [Microtetraspora glauca]|uniref:Uncharacterized protein n=1 Tax=Microtetraspora glauca TaxID=1996 RepID=A0ABV3GA91_MICGL
MTTTNRAGSYPATERRRFRRGSRAAALAHAVLLALAGLGTACAPSPTPDHPVVVRTWTPETPFISFTPIPTEEP